MKKITTFFSLLLALQGTAQQLQTGDIAIIGLTTDPTDHKQSLAFVTLKDIPAGSTITFTDIAWLNNTTGFAPVPSMKDGRFTWTAPGGAAIIKAGNVVTVTALIDTTLNPDLATTVSVNHGTAAVSKNFYWDNSDQIIAYLGTPSNSPSTYLCGYSTTDWQFHSYLTGITSNLPPALVNYSIAFGSLNNSIDNAYFANGNLPKLSLMLQGRTSVVRQVLNNPSLFYKSNTSITLANYPNYLFKLLNSEPPVVGSIIEAWQLNASLANSKGKDTLSAVGGTRLGSYLTVADAYNFPADYDSLAPGGISFNSLTSGYENVNLRISMLMNPGFANSFQVQYSDGSTTWQSLDLSKAVIGTIWANDCVGEVFRELNIIKFTVSRFVNTGWITFQLPLPTALNNLPNVKFRLITVADPLTGNNYDYLPVNPGAYNPNFNIILDYIEVRGSAIGTAATLSEKATQVSGLDKIMNDTKLKAYPNPAESVITLNHEAIEENATVSITDLQGRIIITKKLAVGSTQSQLNVSSLAQGNYIITVNNKGKRTSIQFKKQ